MTRAGILAIGIVLFFYGFLGLVTPISNDKTIMDYNDLCKSGFVQFFEIFSHQIQQNCATAKDLANLVYAVIGIGMILIIVGAVSNGNKKYETTYRETR